MTTVYVSGATGFIAQHVVKQLLSKGYKVIGSVRSTERGDDLGKNFGSDFKYEVVADVGVPGAFDESLKKHPEVSVFLHTASPFHFNAKDVEKDLLLPATEGTKNALKAIKNHGPQIKRVVVTSSYAAVGDASHEEDPNHVNTEESWNEISWEGALKDVRQGYRGSKTFAERAAWQFVKDEKPTFVLSTVNPVLVFGPQAFDSAVKDTLNTSSEVINNFFKLKSSDPVPSANGRFIDVRDVARAHLVAFEKDSAKNQRLVMTAGDFSGQEIADIIHKNFAEASKDVPVGKPGTGPQLRTNMSKSNFSKTENILGFKYIDLEKSVIDSVQQVIKKKA